MSTLGINSFAHRAREFGRRPAADAGSGVRGDVWRIKGSKRGFEGAPSSQESAVIDFFTDCKRLCDAGRTLFLVVHSYGFSESMLIRIRSLCDAHLRLRLEEVGDKLVKMLEVSKVRNAERTTGSIVSFDVEPGVGMRIIPISRAKA